MSFPCPKSPRGRAGHRVNRNALANGRVLKQADGPGLGRTERCFGQCGPSILSETSNAARSKPICKPGRILASDRANSYQTVLANSSITLNWRSTRAGQKPDKTDRLDGDRNG
jgi:hypothetical protein